jgi:hypothetical protein
MWWRCWSINPKKGWSSGKWAPCPDVYEVEFLDSKGHTIAVTELKRADLLLLQHEPVMAG